MGWRWHCDFCGGHQSFGGQGMRDTCAHCGHVDGDNVRGPLKTPEQAAEDYRRTCEALRHLEASGQGDLQNQDPRGYQPL